MIIILWFINLLVCVYGICLSAGAYFLYWIIAFYITFPIIADYLDVIGGPSSSTFLYVQPSSILLSMFFAMAFNVMFLITQMIFFANTGRVSLERISELNFSKYNRVIIVFFVLSLLFLFLSSSNGVYGFTDDTWTQLSASRGIKEIIFGNLANICLIITGGALLGSLTANKSKFLSFLFIVLALCFAILLKVKSYLLVVVCPFVLYISWKKNSSFLTRLIILAVTLAIFMGLYYFIKYVRWSGVLTNLRVNSALMAQVTENSFEQVLRPTYYKIVSYFSINGYLLGDTYLRVLLKPFAFFFNTGAPENPMYAYARIIGQYSSQRLASAHPTLYGDSFANFGMVGIVLGFFWAWLLGIINKISRYKHFLIFSTIQLGICFSLPLAMRGSVYYALYNLILVSIGSVLINFFIRIK